MLSRWRADVVSPAFQRAPARLGSSPRPRGVPWFTVHFVFSVKRSPHTGSDRPQAVSVEVSVANTAGGTMRGALLRCSAVGWAMGGRRTREQRGRAGATTWARRAARGYLAAGPSRACVVRWIVADHEGVTSPLTRTVAEAERHTLVKAAGGRAW